MIKIVNMKLGKRELTILPIVIIAVAAISRLLPHPDNVTPVGAIALFGGAYFSRKYLLLIVPFAALFLSDLVLNNTILRMYFPKNEGIVFFANYMIWGYVAFFVTILIGVFFLKKVKFSNVILATLGSSLLFFLITNLGSFITSPLYPKSLTGLLSCYTAGIPFFRSTILGNLFYVGVMFGSYEWFKNYYRSRQLA